MSPRIVSVVGNPRAQSRAHGLARTLTAELTRVLAAENPTEVDLAQLGPRVLDADDDRAAAATEEVLAGSRPGDRQPDVQGDVLGTLESVPGSSWHQVARGTSAVPVLLGGAPNHQLAVDVHFTPLLLELGARVPVRGLFVLEADVPTFGAAARSWANAHAGALV